MIRAAAQAAREALVRTPEQLAVLREAGVVDAGGRALCVVLDAAESAVTGRRTQGPPPALGTHSIPRPAPRDDLRADGPAYEVMFLLDADEAALPRLRTTLAGLGDSLVVVGGGGLWNVHVHVDDVGARPRGRHRRRPAPPGAGHPLRRAGRPPGRPTGRRRRTGPTDDLPARARGARSWVVAAGPGLAELFAQAGATVVPGGPGRRPSSSTILEAIGSAGTTEVVVLPNDPDSIDSAEAAARSARDLEIDPPLRVAVIATRAMVQGLAALAVHEPGRSFDLDVLEMTAAARHARAGAVTVAVREGHDHGRPLRARRRPGRRRG